MADPNLNIRVTADTSQAQRAVSGFKSSFSQLSNVVAGVGIAVASFTTVFKQAFEIGKEAAQLEFAREQFDNLAVSIGSTSDALINRLGEATQGMMSNADMINSASQIISLGLADSEEDVVRLATVVSELGWDMQQVILTFANDSTMRLDALGLSVEDVTARSKEFEAQGIAATKAFDLAVLAAAEDKIALVGSSADSSAGDFKRAEAAIADASNNLKLMLLPVLGDAAIGFNNLAGGMSAVNQATRDQILVARDAGWSWEEYLASLGSAAIMVEAMDFLHRGEIQRTYELATAQRQLIQHTIELTDEERALAAAAESSDRAMLTAAGVITTTAAAAADAATSVGLLEAAVDGLAGEYNAANTASALLREGIDQLSETMLDQARLELVLSLKDMNEEQRAAAILQFGELENLASLNAALKDGTISRYDWIAAVNAGSAAVAELARQVQNAAGDYDINFEIHVTGDPIPTGVTKPKPSSGRERAGGGFHDGADFIVPPGYSNDSYGPLWVESGERVQVTPAADMANGGGSGSGGTTVLVMLDGKEIAAHVQTMSGRDYRTARNSGARLTGR